jgi:hypothetical protein
MYAAFGGGDIPSIISSLGAGLPASKYKAEPSVAPDHGRQGHCNHQCNLRQRMRRRCCVLPILTSEPSVPPQQNVIDIEDAASPRYRPFHAPALFAFALILFAVCRPNMAQTSSPSPKRDINAVLAAHDKQLLAIPDVVGVYVGTLEDRHTPCLRVMLARKNPVTERKIPRSIEGYPVRVEVSGEIRPMGQQP